MTERYGIAEWFGRPFTHLSADERKSLAWSALYHTLIPRISDDYQLAEYHWEVLSLEASSEKLLSADMIKRQEFENVLRTKLQRIRETEGHP